MSDNDSIFGRLRSLLGKSKTKGKTSSSPADTHQSPDPQPELQASKNADSEKEKERETAATSAKPDPTHDRFKPPPEYYNSISSAPEVDLVLGVDLGTSCSKVVIGDPGWLGQSYAVPIGEGSRGLERFLRVTSLRLNGIHEANLKLRLMDDPASKEIRGLAALYLAGVIRDSMDWFDKKAPKRYKERSPRWSLNLGFPAKKVENGALSEAYREVASLAVRLAASNHPLELSSLRAIQSEDRVNDVRKLIPHDRIFLYPEIAAQLAGYVNSPYRIRGSLILIDVGAGTLDVSTVILRGDEEEDIVSFHFCEVGPFGAMKLLESRIEALNAKKSTSVQIELQNYQFTSRAIPETLAEIVGNEHQVDRKLVTAYEESSKRFAEQAVYSGIRCVNNFRASLKKVHVRADFDPWPEHVRFFFTGGGSRSPFFRKLFVEGDFERELLPYTRWEIDDERRRRQRQGLKLERLPFPPELKGITQNLEPEFDRLSVAHGLAYGSENLMRITGSINS